LSKYLEFVRSFVIGAFSRCINRETKFPSSQYNPETTHLIYKATSALKLQKIILIFIMSEPTNIPAGSTVLVTGVNGFVASHIAKQLLLRGFKVRGTVRDPERTSWLVKDAFKAYVDNGDFELVTIKDFTAAGVYDDAIKGVSAIAHVASVVTFDSDPNTVIPQTVQAATRILEAALNEPSVKTFVYTSSIVASTFPAPGNDTRVTRDTWNDVAIELAWSPPPHPPSQGSIVYAASKAAAEKAVWQFVEDKKPKFRVNSVNPAMIMGEPLDESHLQTVGAWIKKLWDGDVSQLASFSASQCLSPLE
jgi:nucleoside-diphosphate-sugar epimerase